MSTGYIRVFEPDHPLAGRDGYLLEHRKIVFDAGVSIPRGAHVHHKNGVKTDNRLENLEVVDGSEHHRRHVRESGVVTNQFGTFPLRERS
jgi:hypothetical protein